MSELPSLSQNIRLSRQTSKVGLCSHIITFHLRQMTSTTDLTHKPLLVEVKTPETPECCGVQEEIDQKYRHIPSVPSCFMRACNFCPELQCTKCQSNSAFYRILKPHDGLIRPEPGWSCCDCAGCHQLLDKARSDHIVPFSTLDDAFGQDFIVKRSSGASQTGGWTIIGALRVQCQSSDANDGAQYRVVTVLLQIDRRAAKHVPLQTLVDWNPTCKKELLEKWL
jgi:hypothetical protein